MNQRNKTNIKKKRFNFLNPFSAILSPWTNPFERTCSHPDLL